MDPAGFTTVKLIDNVLAYWETSRRTEVRVECPDTLRSMNNERQLLNADAGRGCRSELSKLKSLQTRLGYALARFFRRGVR